MFVICLSSASGTKLARHWTLQSFLYLCLCTVVCRGSIVHIEAEIVDDSILNAESTVSAVSLPPTLVPTVDSTLVPVLVCNQGPDYQQCHMKCECYSNGPKICNDAPDKCATDCHCEYQANTEPTETTYETLATTGMTCSTEDAFNSCKDKCNCKSKNGESVLLCLNAPEVCAEKCTCPRDDVTISPSIPQDFADAEALGHSGGRSTSIDAPKSFYDAPQQVLAKDFPFKCPLVCYWCNGATPVHTTNNQDKKNYPNVVCNEPCDQYLQDGKPWGKCECQ